MRPAARGATNDSPSSARCASGYGPLRERRRAPLRSAGAKRETHLTTDAISVNEGAFAKRDERLSSQRPCVSGYRPVARASEGAGEECRSDERDTLFVSRSATNDSPSSARARAQRLING